nr:multicopper oxidase domain-containing protein [Arsenicicoccus dermatophilus]
MPVVAWLGAATAVSLVHRMLPDARWLLVHLLLLGGVGNAIITWSWHFTGALVRSPASPGQMRSQVLRQVGHNLGAVAVVAGVVGHRPATAVAGALVVGSVLAWHGLALAARTRGSLGGRFRRTVDHYVAACLLLPVGATLGALLAAGRSAEWHGRLVLAHLTLNLLGFVGLTVLGTLVTLWPTMLRTRLEDGSERTAARLLPVLLGAVLVTVGAALLGLRWVAVLGLLTYAAAALTHAVPFARTALRRAPADFATWSVAAGSTWLLLGLGLLVGLLAATPRLAHVPTRLDEVVTALAVGWVAQVLLGALAYLLPVMLGGGPAAVRRITAITQAQGALRVTVTNLALLVCLLPVPSWVRVACSALVLGALATAPALDVRAVLVARQLRREATAAPASPAPPERPWLPGTAAGCALVALAVAGGLAVDPTALRRGDAGTGVTPTGRTVTVDVTARGMRFTPGSATVTPGDRLVLRVTNADADVHDLTLETGQDTGRLGGGETGVLDVGVVGRSIEGWCSVVGHRQMGMTFGIRTTGGDGQASATPGGHQHAASGDAAPPVDLHGDLPAGFVARDATLPPAPTGTLHRVTLRAQEVELPVGADQTRRRWTFNGTAPGPTLRGHVGDRFEITLVNDGSMGHSLDLHAGALAPDQPMRTIRPGESLVYRFTATRAGIWVYHCSTHPMSVHIAAGMAGAVVIDPPGLPPVDREYLLVQSELYLGAGSAPVDGAKLARGRPDGVTFNGVVGQYDARPLTARPGQRVRIWVLDVGPDDGTSFHVVGGQFDRVYKEGRWLLRAGPGEPDAPGGSQVLDLTAAQGGFVELTFPEAGHYPFVDHQMSDAERGAHGIVEVR